jgi:hypothetical protein
MLAFWLRLPLNNTHFLDIGETPMSHGENHLARNAGTEDSPESTARAFGDQFGVRTAATSHLQSEFQRTHIGDVKALTKDIDKCADAAKGDATGISNIQKLMDGVREGKVDPKLLAQVREDLKGDLDGDRQALRDDPKNANRAAYVAALDQAVLDNRKINLSEAQKKLITEDRDNKLRDFKNCREDMGNEPTYIKNDQRLLQALKNPSDMKELEAAAQAVIASRKQDIRLEGVDSRPGSERKVGTGYIGQDENSIVSDLRLAPSFKFHGNLAHVLGKDKQYLQERAAQPGYLEIPPLKSKAS